MSLAHSALAWLLAALAFLALDSVWLTTMTSRLYRPALGHLMAAELAWLPAALFYGCYVAGIVWFAVAPALAERRPPLALVNGALLGLFAYATYDLTNQATLRDWPWLVTICDMVWGGFATGMAAWAAASGVLVIGGGYGKT